MRWLLLETPQPAEQLLHLVPVPTQRLERLQRMRPVAWGSVWNWL